MALSARQASMKDIDGTAGLPRPVPEVGGSLSWALCSSSPARCSSRHSACIPNLEMYVAREPLLKMSGAAPHVLHEQPE